MAKVRGRADVARYFAQTRAALPSLLRGAGRAGGVVIADEAALRSESQDVSDAIVVRSRGDDGRIVTTITVKKGWTYSVGVWLEWGTSAHFISVDDSQRRGMSIGRINATDKQARTDGKVGEKASLVINGAFVGDTVFHPGARAHPFLRPALDTKEAEAVAAAQNYITSRIKRGQLTPGPIEESEDE